MATALVAGPAHADEPEEGSLATCTVNAAQNLSPGLLFETQTVTATENRIYTPCVSDVPGLTTGTSYRSYSGQGNCLTLGTTYPGVETITWNTGQTSTFSFNGSVVNAAGQGIITRVGYISDGLFEGATATTVTTYPALNLLGCLAPPGITSKLGVGELIIASTA